MTVSWRSVSALLLLKIVTANEWPNFRADWGFEIVKDANTDPPPFEEWDARWFHLHRNHEFLPDAFVNTIAPRLISGYEIEENPTNIINVEVRYVIRGAVVSDWIGPPFRFDLRVDGLDQLPDGVHAMTIEARGTDLFSITPIPAFVHLTRENGESFGFNFTVPIVTGYQMNPSTSFGFGPNIVYIDPNDRHHVGYPADSTVTPWSTPPTETDLFQELMAPHSTLFEVMQMWWDHTAHQDAPFIRGMPPMHGEDHRGLRQDQHHEKFPMMDGPRGVGWMSAYIGGQVDSRGRFAFAEVGGRVGYLMPDGEIVTLAGWRVEPGKDPIWWEKPLEAVRANMENRGSWTGQESKGEFQTPLDVAVDPQNENILYVAAYEDHVVWKIQVPQDFRRDEPVVSILAGSHTPGFADGNSTNARFNGPASLVFDPVAEVLYVADQDNDAIRRVTRDGIVTTVARSADMEDRLVGLGVDPFDQLAARAVSKIEVEPGGTPDVYMPQTIRVDSQGRLILLEIGFGAIRRMHPTTLETEILTEVQQKHEEFDRGWAWLDVDRYGSCGPVDGIYWTKFVNTLPGEFQSEVYEYFAPGARESTKLFSSPTGLYPDGFGPLNATNPPHYGWLVAVDPRGAVLLAGGGEHGITRLRLRRDSDPTFSDDYWLGRNIYEAGVPTEWTGNSEYAARSIALQFGRDGHNVLGTLDIWGLFGVSDDDLLDAYGVDELVRSDSFALSELLAYLRPNTFGAIATTSTPAPTLSPTSSAPLTATTSNPAPTPNPKSSAPFTATTSTPAPTPSPTSSASLTVTTSIPAPTPSPTSSAPLTATTTTSTPAPAPTPNPTSSTILPAICFSSLSTWIVGLYTCMLWLHNQHGMIAVLF